MPLWLPVSGITGSICRDIHERTGLSVTFGSVEASWGKGLILRDFVISSPQGFSQSEPMVKFHRFHCDFSPIRMLLGARLGWCEMEGLEINAEVDSAGNVNLGSLKKLQDDDSGGMNFGRISLTASKFTLDVAGNPQKLTFGVRNLQFISGRLSNLEQMTMTADVEQAGTAAPVNLQLSAKGSGSPDVARGMLNFVNVDISQIPLPSAESGFPLKSLGGRCDGMLQFHVNKALQVESLTLDLAFNGLAISPAAGEPFEKIPRVTFRTQAALDAIDEGLDISHYEFSMPGLNISGSGDLHSEFFEGNWRGLEFLKLAGVVEPRELRKIFGNHDDIPEHLDGPLAITAFAEIKERTLKFGWNVDAVNARLCRGGDVLKPLGDAMAMSFAGGIGLDDDTNTLAVEKLGVIFGQNVLTGGGRIENLSDLPDLRENYDSVLEILRRLRLHGTMQLAVDGSSKPLNGTWSLDGGERIHIISTLMADEKTTLKLGDVFVKPAGKASHVDLVATLNALSGEVEKGQLELSCGNSTLQLNDITVRRQAGDGVSGYVIEGQIDGKGLEEFAGFLPQLDGEAELRGEISGTLKGFVDEHVLKPELAVNLNLNRTDIRIGDGFFTKKAGTDFAFDVAAAGIDDHGKVNFRSNVTASDDKDSINLKILASPDERNGIDNATFTLSADNVGMLRRYSPEILGRMNIEDIDGGVTASGVVKKSGVDAGGLEYEIACKPEKISFLLGRNDVTMNGEISLHGKIESRKIQKIFIGELDAGGFDFTFNGDVKKPAGMGVKFSWELAGQDDFINDGGMIHLRSLVGMIGENRFQLAGVINAGKPFEKSPDLSGTDLHMAINLVDPQTLMTLLPSLASYKPEGDAFLDMQLTSSARDVWLISAVTLKSDGVSGAYNGRRVGLNGSLKLRDVLVKGGRIDAATLNADGLGFSVDGENGYLLADVSMVDSVPSGELSLLMDRFDLKDFADWLAGPNRPQSRPARLTFAEKEELKKQADAAISQFAKRFAKADLSMKFSFDSFMGYDEAVDKSYLFDKVYASLLIRGGKLAFDYNGGLAGGVSRGSYACDFLADEPRMVWESSVIDVQATPELMPQINKDFPGNTVDGTFTNVVKVYSRLRDFWANRLDDRYPLLMVGLGKMTARNGYVVGKAAPAFVAKIFPGLNLTKYYYQKMTAYQEFQSNGVCVNDAIFSGKSYDVYMNGTTDLDKNIEYTVGLQLLGSLSSADWKHDWRQGRLPLLKLRGRIEKGKLVDDVMKYPWPNETLGAIFIKNNVFYRAWLLRNQDDQ